MGSVRRLDVNMTRIRLLILVGFVAWGTLAMIDSGQTATILSVKLVATEFAYAPNKLSASPGAVTFVVTNKGSIEHNFILEDETKKKVAEIAIIAPGETAQVNATLRTGTYTVFCSLPGHKEAGMIASLQVLR